MRRVLQIPADAHGRAAFLIATACLLGACAPREQPSTLIVSETRADVEQTAHEVSVASGDVILVTVEQTGADVAIEIHGVDGRIVIADASIPIRRFGPELLWYEAPKAGRLSIRVRVKEAAATPPAHQVRIERLARGDLDSNRRRLQRALSDLSTAPAVGQHAAQAALERAQTTVQGSEDQDAALSALVRLRAAALTYDQLWRWEESAQLAAQAADFYSQLGDETGALLARSLEAAALIEAANSGSAARREEVLRQAIELLERSRDGHARLDRRYEAAHDSNNLGLAHTYLGNSDEAVEHFRAAAAAFRELDAGVSLGMSLQNIAWVHHERGQYRAAAEAYNEPLLLHERRGDVRGRRIVLNNAALSHSILGETEEAIGAYQLAIELQQTEPDETELASSLHGLGAAYLRAGRTSRALEYFERALAYRRGAQDGRALLSTLVALGNAHRMLGAVDQAVTLHRAALNLKVGPVEESKVHLALAEDLIELGRTDEALEHIDALLAAPTGAEAATALPRTLEVRGRALTTRAHLRARAGAYDDALRDLDEAAAIAKDSGAAHLTADGLFERARVERLRGRYAAALQTIEQAAHAAESLRLRAANPDLRATILASRARIFEELIDLQMTMAEAEESAGRTREAERLRMRALGSRERWHARSQLDRLETIARDASASSEGEATLDALYADLAGAKFRQDELREKLSLDAARLEEIAQDIFVLRRRIEALETSAARQSLPVDAQPLDAQGLATALRTLLPDTAVFAYSLGEDASWSWMYADGRLLATKLPARDVIERSARALLECTRTPPTAASHDGCKAQASALRTMLAPGGLPARNVTRVLFASEGLLLATPLAMLARPGESSGWASAQSSSLSGMFQRGRNPRRASIERVGVASALQSSRASAALAVLEARYGRAAMRPLATHEATANAAFSWRGMDLIHIETHGFVDMEDPQLSRLQLAAPTAGGGGAAPRALTLRDVYRSPTDARLVVLAACDTGIGQWVPGEGHLSLAHGFLSAGAESVVASLWRIPDAPSSELLAEFYRAYAETNDHIAALAAAQRRLAANPRWSHPYYWAGLVAHL